MHTCALTAAGRVWCWGSNQYGQLGNGQSGNFSATPVRVLNLSGAKAISAGGHHVYALTNANTLWCWGDNLHGQLGNGLSGNLSTTPVRVLNLSGVTTTDAGGSHTCALKEGAAWCWGTNENGELGNGQSGVGKLSASPVSVVWPAAVQ